MTRVKTVAKQKTTDRVVADLEHAIMAAVKPLSKEDAATVLDDLEDFCAVQGACLEVELLDAER